jgi:hypothetical protein
MEVMALADAAVIVLAESVKLTGLRRLSKQDCANFSVHRSKQLISEVAEH